MSDKIDTVTARAKLKSRREPYWHKISQGCFLGYRKMTDDPAGVWQIRYSTEDGKKLTRTLGKFDQHAAFERFEKALGSAREWMSHLAIGGSTEVVTVMEACQAYVDKVRVAKGDKPADELALRYSRLVKPDPIHKIELTKLSRDSVQRFRRRMVDAPVILGKSGKTRTRSKDTVNRDMAAVRAALNHALESGHATSDFSWRVPLAAFKNVTKRRDIYLDRFQRKKLIDATPPDLAQFITGLSLLPLRPGALASLLVSDFDERLGSLRIGQDKSGVDRKFKVPPELATFFSSAAQNRPSNQPLLPRSDGSPWNRDAWKNPIKEAAKNAGLPSGTVAYSLRHSVISDLVHGGLDLLTVAQISGTSVAMIEKYYGHLRGDVAATALAKLVL